MVEIKKEIVLPNGAVFQISAINRVYFDGEPLLRLSEDVNLDKLAVLMVRDKKLLELTTKYLQYKAMKESINEKMDSIRTKISEMIDNAKTLTYAQLSAQLGCVKVKKNVEPKYVEYAGKNFSMKVEVKNYEFSCIAQMVDEELREICPNINVRIVQSGNSITIYVNGQPLYITNEFSIRKVLSFLKESITNGEFPQFVELLKRLYLLYAKTFEGGSAIVEIIHRIEDLAKMSEV